MKKNLKLILGACILVVIVLVIIFLATNADLNKQVYARFTDVHTIESAREAEENIETLSTWSIDATNAGLSATKSRINQARRVMEALDIKEQKLLSLSINVKGAFKADNDIVFEKYNELIKTREVLDGRMKTFVDGYDGFVVAEREGQYALLYGYIVDEVEARVNFVKSLNDYIVKYVYNQDETLNLQNVLLNTIFSLAQNATTKVLMMESYSDNLINEMNTTVAYYNALNGDYSVMPASEKENIIKAYSNLDNKDQFFASEDKEVYINSLNASQKNYAIILTNLVKGGD